MAKNYRKATRKANRKSRKATRKANRANRKSRKVSRMRGGSQDEGQAYKSPFVVNMVRY
jgi:hypothetical protein